MKPKDSIVEFSDILQRQGVEEALSFLNRRVPHRFTAIYELAGSRLRNLYLCDKQGEVRPHFLAEVELGVSFCQFVLRDGCFLTTDSAGDARLDGHPYQGVMAAYHGVPLLSNDGTLRGTLCHFDTVPRELSNEEFDCLQKAARILPGYVLLPPAEAALTSPLVAASAAPATT